MRELEKDTNIKIRIDTSTKELFYTLCAADAINPSAKIRQLIEQWCKEQQLQDSHRRITDSKK